MSMVEKLEKAMKEKGLSVADLARGAQLPYTTVDGIWKKGSENTKRSTLVKLARFLNLSLDYLADDDFLHDNLPADNIFPIKTKKVPLLGTIAAGMPILAEEYFEAYVDNGTAIHADFCLKIQGDSMINARIHDGDIVFIKKQNDVDNKEIAAVYIDGEATLKRILKRNNKVELWPENPKYEPQIFDKNSCADFLILGKAIAFQSDIK